MITLSPSVTTAEPALVNVPPPPPAQLQALVRPMEVPKLLQSGAISVAEIPNPHLSKQGCNSCHNSGKRLSKQELKQANQTCAACHDSLSGHKYIHPSELTPSRGGTAHLDKLFKKRIQHEGNRLTCTVCHDMAIQCLDSRKQERGLNPYSLRGGPYEARTDMCYRCHERQAYQRLNPHEQIDKQGHLKEDKCALCHNDTSKLAGAKSIADVDFIVSGDLSKMCTGCHIWKPHPGGSFNFSFSNKQQKGPNHLVVPPERIQQTIERSSARTGIAIPLAPANGQVFCGSCHNPHQKGVIKQAAAAHGADEHYRLRKQDICELCHDF